jgi:predicted nucleotidyltransferase component of viral defense system
MAHAPRNIAASARQRLLNLSKSGGTDYNQLLIRYAIERLLYRLSISSHKDTFVLKGAMLFSVWDGSPHRPTQDLDLLGFGDRSLDRMKSIFREICATLVEDDGWTFDAASVEAEEIRTVAEYGGVRVHLTGRLGGAVLRIQTDIGFGDTITPAATDASYPSLLGFPAPQLRTYPRETVVAEKLEAIVKLGMLNTRHKDYYDLRYLARHFDFEGSLLVRAIAATFARRGTRLPEDIPVGLTAAFGMDSAKQAQWSAFCRRLGEKDLPALSEIVADVEKFLTIPIRTAARSEALASIWMAPGPWQSTPSAKPNT